MVVNKFVVVYRFGYVGRKSYSIDKSKNRLLFFEFTRRTCWEDDEFKKI